MTGNHHKRHPIDFLKEFLSTLFDIREGEGLRVVLMFCYIFLVISSLMIAKPVCNALFLSKFGVARLPYVFILVALFAAGISTYISKLLKTFHLFQVIRKTIHAALASLFAFWVLLHIKHAEGAALFIFYVWVAIFALVSTSQFWILANSVFNTREAKRLFGFIGSGAIAGGIFGGYLTKFLAPLIGSEQLLFICIACLSLCIPILQTLKNRTAKDVELQAFRARKQASIITDYPLKLIRNSRHLLLLASILGIGVVVAKLVEYQFSAISLAEIRNEDELTAFFGFWLSNLNIAALLIQLFITRRVVGIFGVGISLFFLPIGIFIGAVIIVVHPALWSAILIKVSDGSLKNSINKAGIELLALPIPVGIKNQVKAFIDIFVDSLATGFGGVLLLLVISVFSFSVQQISVLIIMFLAIWVYLVNQIRYEYIQSFRLRLEDTEPEYAELNDGDKKESILGGLIAVLQGDDEKRILRVLRMVKEVQHNRLVPCFRTLLHHPSPAVRLEVLRNIYFYKHEDFTEEAKKLLFDPDQEIKTEAMHYLFRHPATNRTALLETYLNEKDQMLSGAALLCAARESRSNPKLRKSFAVRERVEAQMKQLPHLQSDEQRRLTKSMCARIIGASGVSELYPYLHILLGDSSREVVQSAILGCGESCQRAFLPILIRFLGKRDFEEIAQEALTCFGHQIIEDLVAYLNNPFVERRIRLSIPTVIAHFGVQKSVDSFLQNLNQMDPSLRYAVIKALNQLRISFPALKFDEEKIIKRILSEASDYANTLAALYRQTSPQAHPDNRVSQEQDQDRDLLENLRQALIGDLEDKLDENLERIFRLLGLKYPPNDIYTAYLGIQSKQPDLRMNAIEFLDNLLEPNLKRVIIPIIETPLAHATIDRTLDQLGLKIPSEFEGLVLLLTGEDTSLQARALELVAHLKEERYIPFIGELINSPDPKVKSNARLAAKNLGFVA